MRISDQIKPNNFPFYHRLADARVRGLNYFNKKKKNVVKFKIAYKQRYRRKRAFSFYSYLNNNKKEEKTVFFFFFLAL